ncbi:MAG: hypothetical protein OEY10_00330 [Nitrosopumilus sp.]|nr:hypothetical protein [Nitrosopumilus sp.]
METERRNSNGAYVKVHDLEPARSFGELVTPAILPRNVYDESNEWLIQQAKKSLDKLTANDYILLIGDPVAVGIVIAVARERQDKIKVLRWNRKTSEYNESILDFKNKERIKNDTRDLNERIDGIKTAFAKR